MSNDNTTINNNNKMPTNKDRTFEEYAEASFDGFDCGFMCDDDVEERAAFRKDSEALAALKEAYENDVPAFATDRKILFPIYARFAKAFVRK